MKVLGPLLVSVFLVVLVSWLANEMPKMTPEIRNLFSYATNTSSTVSTTPTTYTDATTEIIPSARLQGSVSNTTREQAGINPSLESGVVVQSVVVGTVSGITIQNMHIQPASTSGWHAQASGDTSRASYPVSYVNNQAIVMPGETVFVPMPLAPHDTVTVYDAQGAVLARYSY